MIDQTQITNQLESIFTKHKFSQEERTEAVTDLIQVGEALTLDALTNEMPEDQKKSFQALFFPEMKENDRKKVYKFLDDNFTPERIIEARNTVYDKLVLDYINHMNS